MNKKQTAEFLGVSVLGIITLICSKQGQLTIHYENGAGISLVNVFFYPKLKQ